MSTKKARVNDLAKEAGITGKELLEKLHGWGFNDIKSAQSALEFDMELRVRGLMEARGVMKVGGAAAPEASNAAAELGGLIKKKKKKLALDGGADEASHETEPEAPAAPAAPAARRDGARAAAWSDSMRRRARDVKARPAAKK